MAKEIHPLGKLRVLENRALEAYNNGDYVTFAATFDYFGLEHSDKDSLDLGRADPNYKKKFNEIDMIYSGNVGFTGGIRIKPFLRGR